MKRHLIKELTADANLFAECPDCGESFSLRKAIMFYVDGPIPEEAKKLIVDIKKEIDERRKDLADQRKKLSERAEKATIAVNVGKILEKIAPAIKGFKFNTRDCRALFEPIDYLIFNGLTKRNGLIDSIYFIDIKTGNASLNRHQRQIRDAVNDGKVEWDQYRGVL